MTLHLVFSSAGWRSASTRMTSEDVVILIGDGVYLANSIDQREVLVLQEDCTIRGIKKLADTTKAISYSEMVNYCVENNPIVSWNE